MDEGVQVELYESVKKGVDEEYRKKGVSTFIGYHGIQQRAASGKVEANSFGEIEFEGFDTFENKRAPYIRVADDTDVDKLWKLMIEEWGISKPKMIISITDGAKQFVGWNDDRWKKSAIDTDAWIINGGSAALVKQNLGRDMRYDIQDDEKVITLGITDWNVTTNREALTNSSSKGGLWPAKYRKQDCKKEHHDGLKPTLDCHNSHFILVDHAQKSESADINLRAKLERYILRNANTNAIIPFVMVVVEGDYEAIETVHSALVENEMNDAGQIVDNKCVLIIAGSGGAADIITKAIHLMDNRDFNDNDSVEDLKYDIKRRLGGTSRQVGNCVNLLKGINDPKNRKKITVFQIYDVDWRDADEGILKAVLQSLPGEAQWDLEVELNRCDIDGDKILKADNRLYWREGQHIKHLDETMRSALLEDKADLVELLLSYLVGIDTLVTEEWLGKLFSHALHSSKNKRGVVLNTRYILIEKFGSLQIEHSKQIFLRAQNLLRKLIDIEFDAIDVKSNPVLHLFLWAVLFNRRDLAVLLFKRLTTGYIGAALIACRILRALAVFAMEKQQLILQKDLMEHAQEYEDIAIGILENLHEAANERRDSDYKPPDSHLVLRRKLSEWGNKSCLAIAYSTKNPEFIKHDTCQQIIDELWKGRLLIHSKKHWLTLLFGTIWALFLPMLVPVFFPALNPERRCPPDKSKWKRIKCYYSAPITKFAYNTVSYIILLLLFAIFIMTDLRPREELKSPGAIEWTVVVWVGTLIVEEVRQMSRNVKKWFSDLWNRFDLVMYSMFSLSLSLRLLLPPSDFGAARVMYSLTFIMFCLRLLHIGFIFKEVGPRIILMAKIMKDLLFFIFMLALFMVSFGIAQEAILNPNISPSFHLVLQPLYKPYWQLFGELGLEDDEGFVENATCSEDITSMNTCLGIDKYRWMAPTLTAIYMLISNILLINVFIAIFSVTLERAEDNAEALWIFHRFDLILEYMDRPTLAPPLIILNHVYRLIIKLTGVPRMKRKEFSHLSIGLKERDVEKLILLEKKHTRNYFIKKRQISTAEKRLAKVVHEIKDSKFKIEEKIDSMEKHYKVRMDNMERHVAELLKIVKKQSKMAHANNSTTV